MLRRAIQRTRLHLPAPTGHDNGGGSSSSCDDGDSVNTSPSVAFTSLRDDESVRDYFRKRPEDVSDVRLIAAETSLPARSKANVATMSLEEEHRAADVWKRLQTLYGLFQELTDDIPVKEDSRWEGVLVEVKQQQKCQLENPNRRQRRRRQCRRDDGLRSLLQAARLPHGVVLRDLQTLSTVVDRDDHAMPQGFTAGMFAVLGNALYNEMLVAAGQNRISRDVFEELGNCLYADAASVAAIAVDA